MNDADNTMMTCANCGKGEESSGDLKACVACKLVKYCNRECQISHRPLHKKLCKKRAAELHDEALFKEHPPTDDCLICFIPLPLYAVFKSCCGKHICDGCILAMMEEARGRGGEIGLCAFCRTPEATSDEENAERIKKLMDTDNAYAFYTLGGCYDRGVMGMPQDFAKANELWLRSGELGCHAAYYNLGYSFENGDGVEVDKKKAIHFWELGAMNGNVIARHNLGCEEVGAGNHNRACKHFILAAKAGYKKSLNRVKAGFMDGIVTKEEYANTLRAYQSRQDELKSDGRDKVRGHINNGGEMRV